jgi:hypothetical protein
MPGKESKLQKRVRADLKKKGWLVTKIILCSRNGWPDLDILQDGHRVLLEFKAKGKKLEPLQEYVHSQIKSHGGEVYLVDSWESYLALNLK